MHFPQKCVQNALFTVSFFFVGNYYGTPKPPAEPSPVQPDLVDQVLFDEEFDAEVQRKRTTSVSKMDRKDSAAPEEEEEDERPPMVNGLTGETGNVSLTRLSESNVCRCRIVMYCIFGLVYIIWNNIVQMQLKKQI